MFESIFQKIPGWSYENKDPIWFHRKSTDLDIFVLGTVDWIWRISKLRTPAVANRLFSKIPHRGKLFFRSLFLGFCLVGLREEILQPLEMHHIDRPSNEERRKLYRLERNLLKEGASKAAVATLTNELHRENNSSPDDHFGVLSTGMSASIIFPILLARNPLKTVPVSFAIFTVAQMQINELVKHRVSPNPYRSRKLTADVLEAQFRTEGGEKKSIQTVVSELELEELEDELTQVQKEWLLVRRALATRQINKD